MVEFSVMSIRCCEFNVLCVVLHFGVACAIRVEIDMRNLKINFFFFY